jgi:GntR family transcriptional regulator of gluconate operon
MAASARKQMRPLTADSLVELAYDSIRQSILTGRFKPGEHLVESPIAGELEISRAPVREAMQRLCQEGLTVEKPRRGTFVREVSAKDFVDIYNSRIAIESTAVRLAVRRKAPLAPIEKTIDALAKSARRGNVAKTVDLELQVHEQICEASGNQYIVSIFRSLAGPIRIALGMDDAAYENLEDVATEHLPLLEAMRSADANLAASTMEHHIVSTVGPVLERLGGDPGDLLTQMER